ncbi:MAG: dTDP-4-dehydrorhamnose reductase [Bdellovibrio sp.]|nr:dTDP-4-dehydrorhamnose reductase [Bdellovibrio sp.]
MILVFGKNGQVATALQEVLPNALFLDSKEADFLFPDKIATLLDEKKPQIIINASAYTAVDKAEDERETSLTINAKTPGVIAHWCKQNNCTLLHYSTDYVFRGDGDRPWLENDPTSPVNWYGETKLQGEKEILASGCNAYIFRISWVYSPWGNNFPKTILRLAKEREQLSVVNDQWGAPTDARDVARVSAKLVKNLESKLPCPEPGIYHLRFEEYQTWHQFASNIVEKARAAGENLKVKEIRPVTSSEFPTKAKRPGNSRLGSKYPQGLFE